MKLSFHATALLLLVALGCSGKSDEADAAQVPAESAAPAPAPAPALDDPTIIAIFDAANTADIETGELAMQRGSTKEVRDFGSMLAHDHRTVRQQGRDLAQKLAVTPTPPVDDAGGRAHAEAMTMLRSKEGKEFDRAFLAHEVAFHQGVLDAVESTLMPAMRNAELKDLVQKIVPAFQAHMIAAQNLQKSIATK